MNHKVQVSIEGNINYTVEAPFWGKNGTVWSSGAMWGPKQQVGALTNPIHYIDNYIYSRIKNQSLGKLEQFTHLNNSAVWG